MLPRPQEREEAMAETRGLPSYTLSVLAWQAGPVSVPVSGPEHIAAISLRIRVFVNAILG
jgi:hypothetical protein